MTPFEKHTINTCNDENCIWNITEGAKQYIFNHFLYIKKRVLLWERETIIRLCEERGLPETVQKTILQYNQNKGTE